MGQKRGLPQLLRAAFAAGFAVGKSAKFWGRLGRELERRELRGPWRSRSTATRRATRGRTPRSGLPLGTVALLVFAVALLSYFGRDLSRFLPADLFLSRSEQELASSRSSVLALAQSRIDTPYVYGATGPSGYDCSGFVLATLRDALGYRFPAGVRTADSMSRVGLAVTLDQAQPGDLVFFHEPGNPSHVSHVGLYVGADTMINANSYYGRVTRDQIRGNSYFWANYHSTRRILALDPNLAPSPPAVDPVAPVTPPYQVLPPSDESQVLATSTDPAPAPAPAVAGSFSDVPPGHPYAASIALLKDRGVIGGYDDGTFKPTRTVSRVELLKFAFRAFDVSVSASSSPFGDVPADHWGQGYIATAYAAGWVSGYGNGDFGPDNQVTRAEAAKILFKIGGLAYDEKPVTPLYADVNRDSWVAPYAAAIKARNLLDSFGVNFEPNLGMNRASVAEFIVRVLRAQGRA